MAKKYSQRWLGVNPLQPLPHRRAAEAAEKLGDDALAIDSYRALLLLDPIDPADLHLRLATSLEKAGELPAARRHALLALEETPRFRAAHQRLLAIVDKLGESKPADSPPDEKPPEVKPPAATDAPKPDTPPATTPAATKSPAR